jgi:hypothetical protein
MVKSAVGAQDRIKPFYNMGLNSAKGAVSFSSLGQTPQEP